MITTKTILDILTVQQDSLDAYFTELAYRLDEAIQDDLFYNTQSVKELFADSSTSIKNNTTHNTIYFSGIGKNDTIAKKSANMLRSLQFDAHHLSPVDAMHGDMGLLREGDVIMAISKSGSTHELILFLNYVKQNFRNIVIIGMQVGTHQSPFHGCCDMVIELPKIDELDSFNLVPTMSNIVTQLYIDMVAIAVKEDIKMSKKEFVRSHPGGAIGLSLQKHNVV